MLYARKCQEMLGNAKDVVVSTEKQPGGEKIESYGPVCGMGCPGNDQREWCALLMPPQILGLLPMENVILLRTTL